MPSERTRPKRRANHVHEGQSAAVAVIGGLIGAYSPASPTGNSVIDACVVAAAVAAVIYAAASAPWWLLVIAALAAVGVGGAPLAIGLASLAGLVALAIGWRRRDLSVLRACSAALAMNALVRADIDARFGTTAAVGIAVGVVLLVAGMRRRPRKIRRVGWLIGGCASALTVLAVGAFVYEALAARSALADGKREAEAAIDAVERGEYDVAADHFGRSSGLLDDAHTHLNRPWAWPAAVVPVVAQHRTAAVDLTGDGRTAVAAAASAVSEVDPDALRVQGGAIDLAAVEALADPIGVLNDSMDRLSTSVGDADSPWLLHAVRDELDELSAQLDGNEDRLDNVATAVDLAPRMLGADGPRVYLVLFTTPAESRGLGGFVGNYAELTIDAGHITMSGFGRASDLEALSRETGVRITGPSEFLARYGTFGYNTDGAGLVGSAAWRNLTISPNFPSVASVAAEMYPQITGRHIDGVIAIDPYVMATLVGYTGPVTLSTVDVTIDAGNAAQYILVDQYALAGADNPDRIDALEEIAERTVGLLLAGAMPGPDTLAQDLGPLASTRRLAVWTEDATEQDLLRRVGLLGEIPALEGADGWSVAVTNAGGNKIDTFLQRELAYEATTVERVTASTLRATLVNSAPASGLPDVVIGNLVGRPPGTSRLYVSFYSALELQTATLNGAPIQLSSSTESGWNVYSGFITISSGRQAAFELSLSGAVTYPDRVVTWEQPLVIPPVID